MPDETLPDFRQDQTLHQISAQEMNALSRLAASIQNIVADPPLHVDRGETGLRFWLERDFRGPPAQRTVVVTNIDEGQQSLTVRPIRYARVPPTSGEYQWADEPFVAYPDFGHRPSDYRPWVYGEMEVPNVQHGFLQVRWVEGVWLVTMPATGAIHVVVRAVGEPLDNFVTVREIQPQREAGIWNGNFELVGLDWQIPVYPYQDAEDYERFVRSGNTPKHEWPILTARYVRGVWWLDQYIRWRLPRANMQLAHGDCSPFVTGEE